MTPEETKELLDQVSKLSGEHCLGFVFLAEVEIDEFKPGRAETGMIVVWNGGLTIANGLVERFKQRISVETQEL